MVKLLSLFPAVNPVVVFPGPHRSGAAALTPPSAPCTWKGEGSGRTGKEEPTCVRTYCLRPRPTVLTAS